MGFEEWQTNRVSLVELLSVLGVISNPPNLRHQPRPGDRQDRYFDSWFDDGACWAVTGGATHYVFTDGLEVESYGLSPRLHLTIRWPDGREVLVEQVSDQSGFEP